MHIDEAKQQVKDTIEAYLAVDGQGEPLLPAVSQRPIFLVGAPGIGKTAIMAQIAQELGIGLVSYSMTHHTRQSALGLPFIVEREFEGERYEASEYTMSEIVASVYDCMRESGMRRGILFLDEINCVSETLYPSMLQFLQFKTFGRHKVPQGWIVVTAGNPPEYNKSVHEFDIVTLDRVKKISVEPDYAAWRTYAAQKGVHPAVLTFLDIKKECFYSVEQTLDGKSFVTARGWDDLSDLITVYEKLGKRVDGSVVSHYVQNERIAGDFAAYYDLFSKYRDDYRIEGILTGVADAEVLQRAKHAAFDERLSLVGLLLDAVVAEQRAIVEDVDFFVALRDDLRALKQEVLPAGGSVYEALLELAEEKRQRFAGGSASDAPDAKRRRSLRRAVEALERYAAVLDEPELCPEDAFAQVSSLFAADASFDGRVFAAETSLGNAFAFLEEAFGDGQEMLVFVTELTQRPASARYVAQFGSESYYAHNENMILSERQRDLRRRVEELDVV